MSSPPNSQTSRNVADLVESSSSDFRVLERNMKSVLVALKQQHSSMVDLGEKRFKTILQFESFVAESPLSKVVGNVSQLNVDTLSTPKKESTPFDAPDLVTTDSEGSTPPASPDSAKKSEQPSFTTTSLSGTDEENDNDETDLDVTIASEETPLAENLSPMKKIITISDAEETNLSIIKDEASEEPSECSYAGLQKSAHTVNAMYANQFQQDIIIYAENWIKVVSERIKARQLQFSELDKKLQHYTKKVNGLEEKKHQLDQKNASLPPKQQERLERNQLKLRGAREAYDNSGQSLVLLMEEVTERAWKDFYPLLLRCMKFDLNYEADMCSYFSKLNVTIEKLEGLGEFHRLNAAGRLANIEKSHPEELYTGSKRMVRPVLDSATDSVKSENGLHEF